MYRNWQIFATHENRFRILFTFVFRPQDNLKFPGFRYFPNRKTTLIYFRKSYPLNKEPGPLRYKVVKGRPKRAGVSFCFHSRSISSKQFDYVDCINETCFTTLEIFVPHSRNVVRIYPRNSINLRPRFLKKTHLFARSRKQFTARETKVN